MKKQNQDMLQGPLLGSIISYTIPIILTSVLQLLFNAADLVVVGRFCGSISVAAVGATGSITSLIVNLFIGLSVGAGVTVAHGVGSREDEVVHRTVHTAIPMALVSGVVLTIVGITFSEDFLRMMGTPENVLELSAVYMKIYFAGITFTMVYNFAASILRAVGDTKSPLIFLSIAGVVNVVLNLIFVIFFHMNVAGVALATTISQAVSAVAMVIVLMRRNDAAKLCLKKMRFYKLQLVKMIRIGLPAGIQSSLFAISNVLIQSSVNSFGDILMSGNAASQNIEGFLFVTMNSFHQTAVNFIGQNVGAKQYSRVKKIVGVCLASVLVVGIAVGGLMCAFGESLLSIYITDSAEAISWGLVRLDIIARFYFICGLMDVSTGALRGMGASVSPMIISVLGVCGIRIGWVMTVFKMEQFHTPQSLYISYIFSWTVTFLIQMYAFFRIYRKHTGKLTDGEREKRIAKEGAKDMHKISKKDRFLGCFLGGAVGDALGYPVEFTKEESIWHQYGHRGIQTLDQAGAPALITDDTQMTLFNMNGLLYAMTNGKEIFSSVWLAHREWLGTQGDKSRMDDPEVPKMWLYDKDVLHACRAPGISCLSAIQGSLHGGTIDAPVNNSKGCGSIMKAAPFGLFLKYDSPIGEEAYLREVYERSALLSAQTHGHPLGYYSGAYLALLLARIVHLEPGAEACLENAVAKVKLGDSVWEQELQRGVQKAVKLALDRKVSDLDGIHALGEGWVAEEALYISVFCAVRYQNDFTAAIRCAVNHKGDSDSTGAICGNILGAWLGVQAVEKSFDIECLDADTIVREMAEDFYRAVEDGVPQTDPLWKQKYQR